MSKPTPEQRIETLEKQVKALAEDYTHMIYGGKVVWEDLPDCEPRWLRVVPSGKVREAVDA
jgi:hypothetical protein